MSSALAGPGYWDGAGGWLLHHHHHHRQLWRAGATPTAGHGLWGFLWNFGLERTDQQPKPPALGIRGGLASFGEPRLGAENHTTARSARRLAS